MRRRPSRLDTVGRGELTCAHLGCFRDYVLPSERRFGDNEITAETQQRRSAFRHYTGSPERSSHCDDSRVAPRRRPTSELGTQSEYFHALCQAEKLDAGFQPLGPSLGTFQQHDPVDSDWWCQCEYKSRYARPSPEVDQGSVRRL
jgi:hypothetical protein